MFDVTATQAAQLSAYGSAFGAVGSMVGSYFQARSQRSALQFQADMAQINAQRAMMAGAQRSGMVGMKAAQVKAGQTVAFAANGVDVNGANAREARASVDIMRDIDRASIEADAVAEAWGYKSQATLSRASAKGINPMASAVGSMLGSSGQVASSWYQYKKNQPPDYYGNTEWTGDH